jgi:transcriptional regulator with XRE-family HTH domain
VEDERRLTASPEFGALLREFRIAAGLSQEALAERARMSVNGIGALERGYRRTPQRETLALLIGALALDDGQREAFENAARLRRPQRSSSVTVGSWSSGSATGFPLALTSFIGRQTELAEIPELVRRCRLVTITGAGGIGKTQMALHVAAASNGVDEAVSFVGFAPLTDRTSVTESIASAAGVQEAPNRSLLEALVASL